MQAVIFRGKKKVRQVFNVSASLSVIGWHSVHLMRASFFWGRKSAKANFIRKDLLVSPFTPAGRIKRVLFVPFVCVRAREREKEKASQ